MKKMPWMFIWILCLALGKEAYASAKTSNFIDEIPPAGIVIDKPGTYLLRKNLTWNPDFDAVAITIKAENVTLDMRGHHLKSSTSIYKTIGISAIESHHLQIVNGKIQNMGLTGLQCTLCHHVSIGNIVVDGLNVNDTTSFIVPTGILTSACANVLIDQCTVKNINVQTASAAGIHLTATVFSKVTNCTVKNLLNQDGVCSGIGHLGCTDALVDSCHVRKIKSQFINNLTTQGHTAIGLIPFLSKHVIITNCRVAHVTGCCDDAHGMSIFLCEDALVEKCKVTDVWDGVGAAEEGAKATGIEVYADNVKIIDCYVKNVYAINPENKQATGFSCGKSNGVSFIRCRANNVQAINAEGNPIASSFGIGFGWAPDPRDSLRQPAINVLYQGCVAQKCQIGFDSWFHINSKWEGLVSIANVVPLLIQGDDAQRTLSCNPCSECGCKQVGCFPHPFSITINNVAKNNQFSDIVTKLR